MNSSDGLYLCEKAFERLKKGKAINIKPIAKEKTTPSIVSQEAGFDKGYLKISRRSHRLLIDKIKIFAKSASKSDDSLQVQLDKAKHAKKRANLDKKEAESKLNAALADNIRLLGQVREFENQIAGKSNVKSFRGQ
jgi:50S ribosomal subunit-associated GTPase HflX